MPTVLLLGPRLLLKGAGNLLEQALGCYSSGLPFEWEVPDEFREDGGAIDVPDAPNVWTDGGLVQDVWCFVRFWISCTSA